jgi:hypothetical protein
MSKQEAFSIGYVDGYTSQPSNSHKGYVYHDAYLEGYAQGSTDRNNKRKAD